MALESPQPLVKTLKLHVGDTGVAAALLGFGAAGLLKSRPSWDSSWRDIPIPGVATGGELARRVDRLHHLRDRDGVGVDLVLEREGRRLAGVETKASATVTSADFRGLHKLKEAAGKRFACGVVLYDGELCASFGNSMYAVPLRRHWEK